MAGYAILRPDAVAVVPVQKTQIVPVKPPPAGPVFLSVVSEPLDADVVASWKDGGEKHGSAPLSLEVPKNVRVHFEFRKAGYADYAMDVIADQPQTVTASLKPLPRPAEVAAVSERKPEPEKKKSHRRAPKGPDGVVDVLDELK
jgi:hypothetical protein